MTVKRTPDDTAARLEARWGIKSWTGMSKHSRQELTSCCHCKHCGTTREIGVVCKHPDNEFFSTELDATCKRFYIRFDPRGKR